MSGIGNEVLKVSCALEGDSAIDFERLLMEFNVKQYAGTRPKQQAAILSAALLVLDATKRNYTVSTGTRYPTLVDLLTFVGIPRSDVNKALGLVDPPGEAEVAHLAAAVAAADKK